MSTDPQPKPRRSTPLAIYVAAGLVAAVAGFAAVYVTLRPGDNGVPVEATAERSSGTSATQQGLAGGLDDFKTFDSPKPMAKVSFRDGSGATRALSDWHGKVVLLNVWATWCAPCRQEMPELDALQKRLGGDKFEVVAVSIDRGDAAKPKQFLKKLGADHLKLFQDPDNSIATKIGVSGMPTTLLIDKQGREVGRLIGAADWNSDKAVKLVKDTIDEG